MAPPERYRSIRGAMWGLYLTLALGFVGLVVAGVMKGVLFESHPGPLPDGASDRAGCVAELGRIYADVHAELEQQRTQLPADDATAAAGWSSLRARLKALGARCHLPGPESDPLGRAYQKVVAAQRLAESAAVQYLHEVGPTDLEAQKLLREAGVAPTP